MNVPLMAHDLMSTEAVEFCPAPAAPEHARSAPGWQFAVSAVKTEPCPEHLSLAQSSDAQHEEAKLDGGLLSRDASDGEI